MLDSPEAQVSQTDIASILNKDAQRPGLHWTVDKDDARFFPRGPVQAPKPGIAPITIARLDRLPGAYETVPSFNPTGQEPGVPGETFLTSMEPTEPKAPNPWVAVASLPIVTGALGGTLGGSLGALTHPGERLKYAKSGLVRGSMLGGMVGTAGCGPQARVPVETAPPPSPAITVEVSPTATATAEAVTTPAGPNDPEVLAEVTSSTPPTFEQVVAAGSAFRVVPPEEYRGWEGAGVQAQVDAVKLKVPPEAAVLVVQSGDQWFVVATTNTGFYLPADAEGKIITLPYFRTDWATSEVKQYVLVEDKLGQEVTRGIIQLNSHVRPVVVKDGQVAAMIDVKSDGTYEVHYNTAVVPTPEAEVFVPEGFAIGDLGLLRNPETGRDTFQFNPELDWQAGHEREVRAYYELVKTWGEFTGQRNDANRYSFEEFYKKALSGQRLDVPLPVRTDIKSGDLVDMPKAHVDAFKYSRIFTIRLIPVEGGIKFDNIKIQILAPEEFKKLLGGKDWFDSQNGAFSVVPNGLDPASMATTPIHFSTDAEGNLVMTTGSLYFKSKEDNSLTRSYYDLAVGYYDKTGNFVLEEKADFVASSIINLFLEEAMKLKELKGPRYIVKTKAGANYTLVIAGSSAYPGDPEEGQYPQIFTFAK